MAALTITRATLTDSVSAITGDIWNAALVGTAIYDKIDALFSTFGAHAFESSGTGTQSVAIRNTSAGASNATGLFVGNNQSASRAQFTCLSSTYTPAAPYLADGVVLDAAGVGGLSISASNASGEVRFYSGGSTTIKAKFDTNGDFIPGTDNARSCGLVANRWVAVWAVNGTIQTSDADAKTAIRPSDIGTDFLLGLTPVAWQWKDGDDTREHYGFTAQAVDALLGGKPFGGLYRDSQGKPIGLNYTAFVAPLVSGFQDHEARLAALEAGR